MNPPKHFIIITIFSINMVGMHGENAKLVGYYPNWSIYSESPFYPKDIDASHLTHICYAFAKPYTTDQNRNIISYEASLTDPWSDTDYDAKPQKKFAGNLGQFQELKKKHPHLKTLLSIGGWSIWKEGMPKEKFAHLAAQPALRAEFIRSVIGLCIKYDFDGIDLDWEYPEPKDSQNFISLLKELYQATKGFTSLNQVRKKMGKPIPSEPTTLLLTIAAPAGDQHRAALQIREVHQYLDWINLMTYDYHGAWPGETSTNHNAPLYDTHGGPSIEETVNYYLSQGVPPDKIVLGLPLYGRSFAGVAHTKKTPTDLPGLFIPFSHPGVATSPQEPGMILYNTIETRYLTPDAKKQGFTTYWDSDAHVPYIYNERTGDFISYDNEQSIQDKAEFAKQKQLGGLMYWSLAREKGTWRLITASRKRYLTR